VWQLSRAKERQTFALQNRRRREGIAHGEGIIFTCTSFLSKPGKLAETRRALRSFLCQHPIEDLQRILRLVVINEYDAYSTGSFAEPIRELSPAIEFIQKDSSAKGQARSLNIILEMIRPYRYWIHWEESWLCLRPLVRNALSIMDSTSITQLQFTGEWRVAPWPAIPHVTSDGAGFVTLEPDPLAWGLPHSGHTADQVWTEFELARTWPLYSLRPSMNRVSDYLDLSGFNEAPELWPIKFEYEFGMHWLDSGAVKAFTKYPMALRQRGHKSTYE
jgi:hypothetical protein